MALAPTNIGRGDVRTRARILAWALWSSFVVTLMVAIYLGFNPPRGEPIRLIDALWAVSFVGFPTSGALIASRLPGRPLGWLLCTAPLAIILGVLLGELAGKYGYPADVADWLGWGSNFLFSAGLAILPFIPLLLPNGQLPSRRWRLLATPLVISSGVWLVTAAFAPGAFEEAPQFSNPIGIEPLRPVFDLLQAAVGPIFLGGGILCLASLGFRWRRATGHERLQLKWLALGGAVIVLTFAIVATYQAFVGDLGDLVNTVASMVAALALPVTIGIAMLRHRLYDIDIVINRTLVYGGLSGILAVAYSGLVVALQSLLGPFDSGNNLAVAASTLAVAALFTPLRRTLQAFIDRRFYQRKYDAERTLTNFSTRLRDEVDLTSLSRELVGVVHQTVQPQYVSLWLREGRG